MPDIVPGRATIRFHLSQACVCGTECVQVCWDRAALGPAGQLAVGAHVPLSAHQKDTQATPWCCMLMHIEGLPGSLARCAVVLIRLPAGTRAPCQRLRSGAHRVGHRQGCHPKGGISGPPGPLCAVWREPASVGVPGSINTMSEPHSAQGGAIRTTRAAAIRRGQAGLQAARRKRGPDRRQQGAPPVMVAHGKRTGQAAWPKAPEWPPQCVDTARVCTKAAAGAEPLWEPWRLVSPRRRHAAGHCLRIGAAIQQHLALRQSTGVQNSCVLFQTRCIHRRRRARTLCPPRSRPEPGVARCGRGTGLVHTCAELCIKGTENGRLDTAC